MVRVTGTLVEDVNATVAGLKLQLLFGGKFEHIVGVRVADPVKPFCAANVRVVDPDCPGLETLIAVGFTDIANVSPTSTIVADDVEPV